MVNNNTPEESVDLDFYKCALENWKTQPPYPVNFSPLVNKIESQARRIAELQRANSDLRSQNAALNNHVDLFFKTQKTADEFAKLSAETASAQSPYQSEQVEVLRRIAERGLRLSQPSEDGVDITVYLDLWQHMLDEIGRLKASVPPTPSIEAKERARDVHYALIEQFDLKESPTANSIVRGMLERLAGISAPPSTVHISTKSLETIRQWMLAEESQAEEPPPWEWVQARREVFEALADGKRSAEPGDSNDANV